MHQKGDLNLTGQFHIHRFDHIDVIAMIIVE